MKRIPLSNCACENPNSDSSESVPLSILLLDAHSHGGGQVTYVANLAQELTRLGHKVTVGCRKESVLVEHAHEAQCGLLNEFEFRGGLRPRAWWNDFRVMAHFIREKKPHILHVSGSQDHWTAAVVNQWLGHPACVVRTRHNTYPVKPNFFNRLLNRRWTDYHLVVCKMVCDELGQHPAFRPERMTWIHNGVDADLFRLDEGSREAARREFGFYSEDVVCGIASRLVADKGPEFLVRAIGLLKDTCPSLRFLVLGQGEQETFLKDLARELGIADRTVWAGFREDMARCVQAFDIGVQPSIYCDTSSFSLKEQMAAGKPVVASDYGGLTEIVSDGVEGFVVPAGTVEPLAEALRKLYHDPDLRRRMGEAGRQRVLREFTIEEFAKRTVAGYRRALEMNRECAARR